jgi:hypothetical protein
MPTVLLPPPIRKVPAAFTSAVVDARSKGLREAPFTRDYGNCNGRQRGNCARGGHHCYSKRDEHVIQNYDQHGDFAVPSLPVGSYQVRTERPSFKTNITDNVVVVAGGTVRVDVSLQVGQTQQSVEVTAAAQLVQSENARVSTSVSSTLVNSLPVQRPPTEPNARKTPLKSFASPPPY